VLDGRTQADWGLLTAGLRIIFSDMSENLESPPQPGAGDKTPPAKPEARPKPLTKPEEFGGPPGLEPTRYGDWERGGRCVDF
jgi:hypothetical protein